MFSTAKEHRAIGDALHHVSMEPLQPFEGDLHELFERPRKQALSIILKIFIATLILWGPVPNK